jgi:S1-C subfamily serine protease
MIRVYMLLSGWLMIVPSAVVVAQNSTSDVLERALAGVVTVALYKTSDMGNQPLGVRGNGSTADQAYARALNLSGARGSGSGFLVESNGRKYVLTNAHVVESAADATGSLSVFSISQQKYDVRVVGGDALYDFAVLEFVTPPGPELIALPLRQQPARIGEKVFAIGNPKGEYPYTVTDGIISAKNRMRGGLTGKFGFLQTTATVIWGNSGGPLIDEQGQVLGINSQIAITEGPDGSLLWLSQINFALETPVFQRLLIDVLTNDGFVRRAYLGIEVSQRLRNTSDQRKQSSDEPATPILSAILADSPVKSQLTPFLGKPITAVNGEAVRNIEEVLGALEAIRPGTTLTLTFRNDQSPATVTLKAGTLSSVQLESIARFVFSSNRMALTNSPDGVTVRVTPSPDMYQMNKERRFQKMPAGLKNNLDKSAQGSVPSSAAPTEELTVRIVAAGEHSQHSSKLWRVSKLSYLGAVCRLMGLSGAIDMVMMSQGDDQSLRFVRKSLTDDGQSRACLWY